MLDTFYRSDRECVLSMEHINMVYENRKKKIKTEVLKDFNLSVHQGEFIAVLGPSGCGKSTLLSIIAGILNPTSGSVKVQEKEIQGMDWHRAMMFQYPTLYPWMDVYKNVAYGPDVRKQDKEETDQKVRMYLELVGLGDFIHSKTYELSGGMKQRVALARILVNEPSIILMDEPFGALDAFTRSNMQILLRDIWRKTENTVILITHDVDEALELASRIIVLSSRPSNVVGMFNAMFSHPLMGNRGDDEIKASGEYMKLRREILDLIKV